MRPSFKPTACVWPLSRILNTLLSHLSVTHLFRVFGEHRARDTRVRSALASSFLPSQFLRTQRHVEDKTSELRFNTKAHFQGIVVLNVNSEW